MSEYPFATGSAFCRRHWIRYWHRAYKDFELIISDNASTDRTQSICREYAARDPRVRYYRSEQDMGLANNFNCLFIRARGEYFKWAAGG